MIYSELYRVLWRRKVLVLLGTAVATLSALVISQSQEKRYTATATVRVEPAGDGSANDRFEASQRLSRSYAEIYTQGAVLEVMSRTLRPAPPVKRSELAAGQVKDLDLLGISGVATDRRRAVAIARAGVRAMEGFSPRERLAPIALALPSSPSSPNVRLNVLLALVAGFVLSCGLVLAINAIQQPIGDSDDLEQDLGLTVLAIVPRLKLAQRPAWSGSARGDSLDDPLAPGDQADESGRPLQRARTTGRA